jgi:hypothetical protein
VAAHRALKLVAARKAVVTFAHTSGGLYRVGESTHQFHQTAILPSFELLEEQMVMEVKRPEAVQATTGRTADGAFGFSIAIALGLLLFIAGLIVSLTLGEGDWTGLLLGIPLMMAGVILPLFMMRQNFSNHSVEAPCPNCGTFIKTSDATLKLECPSCHKLVMVRDSKLSLAD